MPPPTTPIKRAKEVASKNVVGGAPKQMPPHHDAAEQCERHNSLHIHWAPFGRYGIEGSNHEPKGMSVGRVVWAPCCFMAGFGPCGSADNLKPDRISDGFVRLFLSVCILRSKIQSNPSSLKRWGRASHSRIYGQDECISKLKVPLCSIGVIGINFP